MFFLLAKKIETISDTADSEGVLIVMMCDVAILKKAVKRICRIIIQHEKINHEDGRDFFSLDQWKALHSKVASDRFREERGAIEKGRSFVTAYKTPMGKAIEDHMLNAIQAGYVSIDKGDISMGGIYEMNIHRLIIQLWEKRISDYKKNIERVRKIIYKEK